MRLLGLVTREFASPEAFLAFVARRALLLSAAGIAAIVLGAVLVIAAHAGTGIKIWFAAICIAGAAFAYAGVQARLWAPRALRLSSQSPTPRELTTVPMRGSVGLRAALSDGAGAAGMPLTVAWGSFGARRMERVPARVYGPLSPGSLVLVRFDGGYALGTIGRARAADPPAPAPAADPFSTAS
jgi:hypothetical protein